MSTLRQQIRDWWRTEFDGAESVDVKVLAAKGALAFRQDADFCARFFDEFVQPLIYEVGINLLAQQRSAVIQTNRRLSSAEVVAAIDGNTPDWADWFEHDRTSGRHISLFLMTKEQALAAADAREVSLLPDLRRIGLLRLAADRLQPGQRIGDVWTADELAVTERRILVGRPRMSLGPVEETTKEEAA